jgi:hypothetical protein
MAFGGGGVPPPRREANAAREVISDSRKIRALRSNPVFFICVCPSVVELIGSKATAGKFCTRWLQARRARSDAPYHAGLAAELFDCTAHLARIFHSDWETDAKTP